MSRVGATPHVLVIGGGLAGLSCAISCLDSGARVTLLEGRPRFGGATWSFRRNGLAFDNGQHVFLRCCTAYRRFLERLGTTDLAPIQERLAIPVLRSNPCGAAPLVSWIRRGVLPAPAQLVPALMSYRHLGIGDRLRLGRAVLALRRLRLSDPALDEETFLDFLVRHGQRPSAVEALFDLITLPTVNIRAREASLAVAAKVFKTGLLGEADASDLGWANVPLTDLHVAPAVELLQRGGATVRGKAKAQKIEFGFSAKDPAVRVVVDGEDDVEADVVVLAVPHDQAAELLPRGGVVEPDRLHDLGSSPIVDIHLVYDRKISPYAVAAALASPVQFVFDRSTAAGIDGEGQCLAISVSAADAEVGERPEVLIDRYSTAIADLFPAARRAQLVDAVVSREHAATFRAVPGTARLRPGPETGFPHLFLAGAWTDTAWPATMEGAVRSGTVAAFHAMRAAGQLRARLEVPEEVVA